MFYYYYFFLRIIFILSCFIVILYEKPFEKKTRRFDFSITYVNITVYYCSITFHIRTCCALFMYSLCHSKLYFSNVSCCIDTWFSYEISFNLSIYLTKYVWRLYYVHNLVHLSYRLGIPSVSLYYITYIRYLQ